jgi:hypothetical protein
LISSNTHIKREDCFQLFPSQPIKKKQSKDKERIPLTAVAAVVGVVDAITLEVVSLRDSLFMFLLMFGGSGSGGGGGGRVIVVMMMMVVVVLCTVHVEKERPLLSKNYIVLTESSFL